MGEKIAFENGWISDFRVLVTLTLDRVILHTVMHHLSTSTYIPNFIEIEESFCGRKDGRTFESGFIKFISPMQWNDKKGTDGTATIVIEKLHFSEKMQCN